MKHPVSILTLIPGSYDHFRAVLVCHAATKRLWDFPMKRLDFALPPGDLVTSGKGRHGTSRN